MNSPEIAVTRLSCKRCGYGWIPRTDVLPEVCPGCKSRRWNQGYPVKDAVEELSPVQRRHVESFIRVMKYGDSQQVRALQLIVEGQLALLSTPTAEEGKPDKPAKKK